MTDRLPEVKVITISYDEDSGLEVDYDGCSPYEAWAFLVHGVAILEDVLDPPPGGGRMKLTAGRWQFTSARSSVGGLLVTLTHHDRSWQVHAQRLSHRPFSRR